MLLRGLVPTLSPSRIIRFYVPTTVSDLFAVRYVIGILGTPTTSATGQIRLPTHVGSDCIPAAGSEVTIRANVDVPTKRIGEVLDLILFLWTRIVEEAHRASPRFYWQIAQ
jgi:hypothetical protein